MRTATGVKPPEESLLKEPTGEQTDEVTELYESDSVSHAPSRRLRLDGWPR